MAGVQPQMGMSLVGKGEARRVRKGVALYVREQWGCVDLCLEADIEPA